MNALVDPKSLLTVRAWQDPIAGKPSVTRFAAGISVAEMAASVPLSSEALRPLLEARIDGHLVYREHWHRVRPKPVHGDRPVFVTFHVALHGGGGGGGGRSGGGKILSAVAAIALIGVSLFAAPIVGALGFTGKAATLLTAGLQAAGALGASLLLQGLAPRPALGGNDATSGDVFGSASAQNSFEPGAPLQRIVGTAKAAPQVVVPPFTEMDNGTLKSDPDLGYRYDQYVTTVLALAGRHSIDQVRIGDVDTDVMRDVEVEIREGSDADTPLTLVTDTRIEEQPNIQLSEWDVDPDDTATGFVALNGTISECETVPHVVETKLDPDAFRFEFLLTNGLWKINDAQGEAAGLGLRIRMRRREGDGWGPWANLPQLMIRAYENATPIRLQLLVKWVESLPTSTAWPPTWKAMTKVKGWAQPVSVSSWNSYLMPSDGTDRYAGWEYESDRRIVLNLDTDAYPKGRYQFEIERSWPFAWSAWDTATRTVGGVDDLFGPVESGGVYGVPDNPAKFHDDIVLTSVQNVWDEYPIAEGGNPVTLIAIRARNRQLGEVTVIGTGLIEDWDGSSWVADQATDNPASWYRHVLAGIHNARPVPEALIDDEALQEWHRYCSANGKRVSAVVKGRSVIETLQMIALCGWGSPVFAAKHGVVIDRVRRFGPVGVITQRNASGFRFEKPFSEIPHALRVTFTDEDLDYRVREIPVYRAGYNADGSDGLTEASLFQTISYEGLPTEALATARGAHDLAWMVNRNRIVRCVQDIEHLEHRRGDLVMVETDILGQQSGRGRVRDVFLDEDDKVFKMTLDEERDFTKADAASATRGVMMRLSDGTLRVEEVTADDSDLAAIVFATPFTMPQADLGAGLEDLIVPGTLVATGTYGLEARPMIVQDIAPGDDLTAELALVDYASQGMYGTGFTTSSSRGFSSGFSAGFR